MSFYSYDVSLNISAPAVDVGVPDRGTKSSDIKVDSNINWINASVEQDVELPTGSERFIFDMNNPLSWPGTGATIFDLSGNGYDCEHAQLGLLYDDPAADTATDAPCSYEGQTGFNFTDDSTVLDYIDTGSNIDGRTYLHINPDLENENVKYIRWPAPGTNADNFTFFMVTEGVFIDDYEPSSTINPDAPEIDNDPNGDFTIVGDLFRSSLAEDEFSGVFSADEANASAFSRSSGVFLFVEDGLEGQNIVAREHGFRGLNRVF